MKNCQFHSAVKDITGLMFAKKKSWANHMVRINDFQRTKWIIMVMYSNTYGVTGVMWMRQSGSKTMETLPTVTTKRSKLMKKKLLKNKEVLNYSSASSEKCNHAEKLHIS